MTARAVLAFFVLMLGGANALLAGVADTCTQNSPDSLYGFVFTLPLNLLGMALLGWRPKRLAVVLAAALPAVLALRYTMIALDLANGTPACTVITGDTMWQPSGDEQVLTIGWSLTALIFWIGLATALAGGYRRAHDRDADHFT